jgi:lysozyme
LRAVPDCTAPFVKTVEGCKLTASPDVAGHMDAGYGHDDASLTAGHAVTQAQADAWLAEDLNTAAQRLAGVVDEAVILDLTDNQYAALISFVFNLGAKPEWSLWKLLNARDYDHVPEQMMRFVYAGGVKVQGLVNRRAAEVRLWSTAEPGSVPDTPSSAVTRAVDTPPLPGRTQSIKAHVVTAVCAAGALCTQYAQPVKDAADQLAAFSGSHIISHISEILLTVAGLATLAGLVSAMLKNKQAAQ